MLTNASRTAGMTTRSMDRTKAMLFLGTAELIRMHHSPDFSLEDRNSPISEEELLFYADKVTLEDRKVSLEERFSKSREKCLTKEAMEKHGALYEKAKMIRDKVLRGAMKDLN